MIEFVFEDGESELQLLESHGSLGEPVRENQPASINQSSNQEALRELLRENPPVNFNQNLNEVKPFAWDKHTTQLLVERYMHHKDAFRNPKMKKKKLWAEIKNTFLSKGHNVNEDILDRKWRNMKKTYVMIKDNVRKTGRGRIHWEYYHQFNEIYKEDKTVNLPVTITSAPVSVIQQKENLELTIEPSMDPPQQDQPQQSHLTTPQKRKETISLTPSSKRTTSKSGMFYLKKRLADIEEARVKEIQLLRNALERHNEIQEERNTILKKLCEAQKKQ